MLLQGTLNPSIRLQSLETRTPSQRTPDETVEMICLRQQVQREALERFRVWVEGVLGEEADLFSPVDYYSLESTVEELQIDLTRMVDQVYISPEQGQRLLLKASGNRVATNSVYRQAQRRADLLRALLDRAERYWANLSPEDTEWKSKALAAEILDPIRKYVTRAEAHAKFCEAAFWSVQRVCDEIVELVNMYDRAGQVGPPVER